MTDREYALYIYRKNISEDVSNMIGTDKDLSCYLRELNPVEFDRYKPPRGKNLKTTQVRALHNAIRILPQDRNMLLYFWRFVFNMDIKVIKRYAGVDFPNGVIEVLRFACKRYLGVLDPISDLSMRNVFELLSSNYEIVLVTDQNGICWFKQLKVNSGIIYELASGKGYLNESKVL